MLRLMMATNGNNVADVAGGAGLNFLGFPVVLVHPLESRLTGTTSGVACLFGDLSQACTMGTRREISVKTDASRFIEFDQLLTFATATSRWSLTTWARPPRLARSLPSSSPEP